MIVCHSFFCKSGYPKYLTSAIGLMLMANNCAFVRRKDFDEFIADVRKRPSSSSSGEGNASEQATQANHSPAVNSERYTHLANPWISMREYNLASNYCNSFDNMTRMDWMELAIIEKLHNDGLMPDDEFNAKHAEITSRPPRGLRKNTKVQKNR